MYAAVRSAQGTPVYPPTAMRQVRKPASLHKHLRDNNYYKPVSNVACDYHSDRSSGVWD